MPNYCFNQYKSLRFKKRVEFINYLFLKWRRKFKKYEKFV